jgi:hypothetical protein
MSIAICSRHGIDNPRWFAVRSPISHQRGRIRSPACDRQGARQNHTAIGQIFAEAPARGSPIQGHNDGPEWQAPILPTGPRPASHHHDHRGQNVGTGPFKINRDLMANPVT